MAQQTGRPNPHRLPTEAEWEYALQQRQPRPCKDGIRLKKDITPRSTGGQVISARVSSTFSRNSGSVYTEGTMFYALRGEAHGPHVARTEMVSLTVFDGPLTVNSVD